MGELRVHRMDVGDKKKQPVDDRANVWCTNCKGQGHMRTECPSPQSLAPKCRYCGGNHDLSVCTKMANDVQQRNQNGQVYHVDNNNPNNVSGGSNNNGNGNRGNNQNQNFNQNRNFNQGNNYNDNNQQGNVGSNLNPNFNANNFNNGGYNNNPNRYFPQQPTNQNQGWNQLPFGNPYQGNPTYGGQIPKWFNNMHPRGMNPNVICYNC